MAAPSRFTHDDLLDAARALLIEGGTDAVTMQAVADRLGVKAPSLYKHVADRADLLRLLALGGFRTLAVAINEAAVGIHPILRMAEAWRRTAKAEPALYRLMLASEAERSSCTDTARRQLLAPITEHLRPLVGGEQAVTCARLIAAFVHGYVLCELDGLYRQGGDPDGDFAQGLALYQELVDAAAAEMLHG